MQFNFKNWYLNLRHCKRRNNKKKKKNRIKIHLQDIRYLRILYNLIEVCIYSYIMYIIYVDT